MNKILLLLIGFSLVSCQPINKIEPTIITEQVPYDSDDPAIWLHPTDLSKSLIIGSDKDEADGGIYAFDLTGKKVQNVFQRGMAYPNNVDIKTGFKKGNDTIDIAVSSEREANKIRIYKLPELTFIDQGGFEVFEGEDPSFRRPMGVAFHTNPNTGDTEVFVSRKQGPTEGYLGHYKISSDSLGILHIDHIRNFGKFSGGTGEIEAIAVDSNEEIIYYSDEACCIRAYSTRADQNNQLFQFGEKEFKEDREGIAIYKEIGATKLIISNQQEHAFNIYTIKNLSGVYEQTVYLSTTETDGCDLTTTPLPGFPNGIFVAMSDDRTFHYYDLKELLEGNVTKQ